MKFKSACLSFALSAALASPLSAAVIIHYSSADASDNGAMPVDPAYLAYTIEGSSGFGPAKESAIIRGGGSMTFSGWDSEISLTNYVGFTITPRMGYSLNLEDLSFSIQLDNNVLGRSTGSITSYAWAYRIHHEGGMTEGWIFSQPSSIYDPDFVKDGTGIWDFEDIRTTGTMEFGLFAASDGPAGSVALDQIIINGFPTIPEPTSMAILGLSSLALWCRNRNLQS